MSLHLHLRRLIDRQRLRSAARRYASKLGPQLRRSYGGGTEYSPRQIEAAARKCGLPVAYLDIGYAAYLHADGFQTVASARFAGDYLALRRLFLHFAARGQGIRHEPMGAETDPNIVGGGIPT